MYTVIPTEQFEKDVKYYIKKKGFRQMGILLKSGRQIQIPRQGSPTGIGLFITQSGMMRKCICLRFIIKRMIAGYQPIRRLWN